MLTTDQQKLIIFLVAWCGFTDREAMEFIKLFWGEKKMNDIQTLTDAEFDRRLQEKVVRDAAQLLSIPGIYEAVSEHYNNEILEEYEQED